LSGPSPEAAVRARRKLTNRLIAEHQAARLRPFLDPAITLVTGDGSVILGAEAVVNAFAGQFADPAFVKYVRTTTAVTVDQDGARAAEEGDWLADWKGSQMSGRYMAAWKKVTGQWILEAELYVSLAWSGT
jgi:hypothetical protein